MRIRIVSFLLCLSHGILIAGPGLKRIDEAGHLTSQGPGPLFYIDYTNYEGAAENTFVEFYIQLGYADIQFVKSKNGFRAGYNLGFRILKGDEIVAEYKNEDIFDVKSFEETYSPRKARVTQLGFSFDPGVYRLEAGILDNETQKISRIEETFRARSFLSDQLTLSDVQLSQKITFTEVEGAHVKNKRYIEPLAVRNFTHGLGGIYVYFEIYNLAPGAPGAPANYTAQFLVTNRAKRTVANFKLVHDKPGVTSAESIKLPVDNFTTGRYELVIRITDNDSKETATVSREFTVIESPLATNGR